jgi:5-methylcytosine-specific restriction endonuclease McrA
MRDLKQIIIAHLRRIGYRNTTRRDVFEASHKARGKYECANCKQHYKRTEVHGDHIEPVIDPTLGWVSWDSYIHRLFYGQLQVLCITCHKDKTKRENRVRWEEI